MNSSWTPFPATYTRSQRVDHMANMAPRFSLRTIHNAPRSTRSSSTSFFPTSSGSSFSQPQPLPASSLWFTARPSLHQTLQSLHETLVSSRSHLVRAGLLPSIDPERSTLSPAKNAQFATQLPHPRARRWKSTKEMATYLRNGTDLKSSQYKSLTRVLGELEGLLPYAQLADQLAPMIKDAKSGALTQSPKLVVDPVLEATQGHVTKGSGTLSEQLETILTRFVQQNKISSSGISV